MLSVTDERLAGIRARLRDALSMAKYGLPAQVVPTFSVNMQIVRAALSMAINMIVPNMSSFTATWVALMLRDAAESADSEGESDLALDLHFEANALDNAWDDV